jgi:hypothetical protein
MRCGHERVLDAGDPGKRGVRRGGWYRKLSSWERISGHPPIVARKRSRFTP